MSLYLVDEWQKWQYNENVGHLLNMINDEYRHVELDNDMNYYSFKNSDVEHYNWSNQELNAIIDKWQNKIKQHLFIIGNYFYFTLEDKKYYISLSSSTDEENYINDIINDFNSVKGVKRVVYEKGRLD